MKKLFALILAVVMIATMSTTAFAANTEGGSTKISFNVDPTYTVTIPATVTLNKVEDNGTVTYENDYTLTAQAGVRLKKGEYIEVTVASGFEMTTEQGATLDYTLTAQAGVRLKKGEYIEVTVASGFEMTTEQGATLDYTITKDGNAVGNNGVVAEFATDKAEQTATIHIAANDPDYAGEYKDTVTFTLEVKTN